VVWSLIAGLAPAIRAGSVRLCVIDPKGGIGLLLSQGRAVGVTVVAAVQDPSKEVLPIRQLFTVRVGLRMTESSQTTMVLGAAAREAGAVCDDISTATPGVGYVMVDGTSEPLRVRAFHVTDTDIDYLTKHFTPARAGDRPDNIDERSAP